MSTSRRFWIYGFGFLLGSVMVYFILFRGQDRSYWFPGNRVKELVLKSDLLYSPHAVCVMNCRKISKKDVVEIIKNGDVNFDESNIHNTACPSYAIDGSPAPGRNFRIIITTVDSVAEVETAIDLNAKKDSCLCR